MCGPYLLGRGHMGHTSYVRLGDLWRDLLRVLSQACVVSLSVISFFTSFGTHYWRCGMYLYVRLGGLHVPLCHWFIVCLDVGILSLFLLSWDESSSTFCTCCTADVCFPSPSSFPFSFPFIVRFSLPKVMVSVGMSVSAFTRLPSMFLLASCVVGFVGTCLLCFCPFPGVWLVIVLLCSSNGPPLSSLLSHFSSSCRFVLGPLTRICAHDSFDPRTLQSVVSRFTDRVILDLEFNVWLIALWCRFVRINNKISV